MPHLRLGTALALAACLVASTTPARSDLIDIPVKTATALQKGAQWLGGDAVVDIKSIARHEDLENSTGSRCGTGTRGETPSPQGAAGRFRPRHDKSQ